MKTRNIISWIIQALLAIVFLKSGFTKLTNLDGTRQMFSGMGMPGWMGAFIGGAEILGAIGLLVPRTTRLAAMGLILVMIGALVMHATKIPGGIGGGAFAAALLVLLIVVLVLRRSGPGEIATDGVVGQG